MNRSEVSGVIFLDLKKAFGPVDHNIMYKLRCYLQNSSSLPFFKSCLQGRTQRVFLHGSYSSEGPVKFGVPQGSVIGPILFSIFFINDLPLHVTTISVACDMLADDTTLHTSGKRYYAGRTHLIGKLRPGLMLVRQSFYGHQFKENPLYDNRYKAEASAVTFIA